MSYIKVENTMAKNGYNLTLGGDGKTGNIVNKKTRKKMSKAAIRNHANRNQVGSVFLYNKTQQKYKAQGPCPDKTHIGIYSTKQMAVKALNDFLQTGEKLPSDIRRKRKRGTRSIRKRGKRYEALISKTFDTPEECEEWLKQALKF